MQSSPLATSIRASSFLTSRCPVLLQRAGKCSARGCKDGSFAWTHWTDAPPKASQPQPVPKARPPTSGANSESSAWRPRGVADLVGCHSPYTGGDSQYQTPCPRERQGRAAALVPLTPSCALGGDLAPL